MIDQIPQEELSIQKQGLRNGLVAGILSIIYTLILYIIGGELMFNFWMQLVPYVIITVVMIFTVQNYRKTHENYVSFRTAFGGSFPVGIFGMMLPLVFAYILYAFIDPDLTMRLKDYTIKTSIEMFQWFNMSEEEIDRQLDIIKEQDYSPKVFKYATGYLGSLIFIALFAAIVSLVFWLISRKYEPAPEFNNPDSASNPNILDS